MHAQVGRADLLRALSLGCTGSLALEHTDTIWWGYAVSESPRERNQSRGEPLDLPVLSLLPPGEQRTSARSALRMPWAWVAEQLDSEETADEEGSPRHHVQLSAQELQPQDEPSVAYQDLVPLPRLIRSLSPQLQQPRPGGVDLPALVQASAGRRWPRRLPRLVRHVWPSSIVLMLDFSDGLYPYCYDMYRVVALLRAHIPRSQLQVVVGEHGPTGMWEPLDADPRQADSGIRLQPQAGCTYLLLSDLGLLRPASELSNAWCAWLTLARERQCVCTALSPVAAEDVSVELAALVRLLRWSPGSRLIAERGRSVADAAPSHAVAQLRALDELLACLSATLRMDPPLLRALRQSGSTPLDASLEGRLWGHPEVCGTTYACLRREFVVKRQRGAVLSALGSETTRHHRHWPLGMRLVDGMQQLTACAVPDPTLLQRMRDDLLYLAHSVKVSEGNREALDATADYVLRSASTEVRTCLGDALDALAHARGQPTGARRRWSLRQRGEQLLIATADETRPNVLGVVLCSDLGQAAPGELVLTTQPGQPSRYLSLPAHGVLVLPPLQHDSSILLGGRHTHLSQRRRSRGVWGWRQSDEGLIETTDLPWSTDLSFPKEGVVRGFALLRDRRGDDVRVGIDRDEYGIFLEVLPLTGQGSFFPPDQPLRFRYLEPGAFLQGSPQGIRHNDEHPQHPVTLSQGLWLAETPCTQALWQAVMGNNPSHFRQGEDAPRRPVENVSWDAVQTFLKAVQLLVLPPGCEAVLPTESQWEYACRAGTQTLYWWGDEPDDARANWNEQHKGTTPVDRYPPNPWGLHDMHGNVWEWCADGQRDYADSPERDPEGPGDGDFRAVRGGSWLNHFVSARAACRFRGHRGNASRSLGFRFALRSPSGPDAWPGGPGAARRGGTAGGRTVGADAPAAELPRRDDDDAGSPE